VLRRRRLVVQDNVVAGVTADARHRAQGQPFPHARPPGVTADHDERRQPDLPRGHGDVLIRQRPVQCAERPDEEEVEQHEERDPDGPENDREGDLH